jgi:hypothetical protein
MSKGISRETEKPTATTLNEPDSRQQPVWHVIVLGIFATPLIYTAYWTYKTYRDLKRESHFVNGVPENPAAIAAGIQPPKPAPLPRRKQGVHLDMHLRDALAPFGTSSPLLRGLGTLIPLLNIYLLTCLTIGVANLVPSEGSFARKNTLVAAGCVIAGYLAFVALGRLPGAWFFASLLGMIPLGFAQHWLNQYWAHVEDEDVLVRHGFSIPEMVIIIVGASVLGLGAAGFMIGVK